MYTFIKLLEIKLNFMRPLLVALFCIIQSVNSQILTEINPPSNIKTIQFSQGGQTVVPIFRLGDSFQIQFDDLYGDEANYYFTITHCNYDWTTSVLAKNEYLTGYDEQRIQDYQNSFNCLQIYSHYTLAFPNKFTSIKLSGNYIIKILDEDKNVVFSRKFIVFEDLCKIPIQVKRSRDMKTVETKHNLDFSIKSDMEFQNPIQNVKVLLMQNGHWPSAIYNVKPQYTIGTELIYKYNQETQFWAGNEFRFWDNKDLRAASNTINRVQLQNIYHSHLYTAQPRGNFPYTFYPDANGTFIPRNINSVQPSIEADYAWVFVYLDAPSFFEKKDIYVTGMFNNYALLEDNKLRFNKETNLYEGTILAKQGFVNYQFTIADKKGNIDYENTLDGNFFQTENMYYVIVYYRANGERYDRVIGKGTANSENIIN